MRGILRSVLVLSLSACAGLFSGAARAQGNSGSIEGSVKDPSGAAVVKATVEISNPVSSYSRSITTGADGSFRFTNVPFNPYHLVVTAAGFSGYTQDVDVRSTVPATVEISLKIATTSSTVTVESNGGDLIETDSTAHTDIDRGLFDTLPLESQSSSVRWLRWPRLEFPLIRTGCFMDSGITRPIPSRWTTSRSPTSKAKFSQIRFP
jgi:Carboxypeptidase regulatory-like domain